MTLAAWLGLAALPAGAQVAGWDVAPLSRRGDLVTPSGPAENTFLITRLLDARSCVIAFRPLLDGACADSGTTAPVVRWTRPWGSLWVNSGNAVTDRDGAVWQGRGLTVAGTAGARVQWRWIDLSFRPAGFVSQNVSYSPVIDADKVVSYQDPIYDGRMDHPYRFGDVRYGRFEPGDSWIRVGGRRVSAGFTTATQTWGPAHVYPLQIAAEAAGYPRVFAQATDAPVGVGRLSAHYSIGRIESSGLTELPSGGRSRIVPAAVVGFEPAGARGLMLGMTRLFHVRWSPGDVNGGIAGLPFRGLLKKGNPADESFYRDWNQIATVFARVAPPGAGVEVYGEFLREDHNNDGRDLIGELDHSSAWTLGLRRAWRRADVVHALTLETSNGRVSHLATVRPQGAVYTHGLIEEGHTVRGQALGSMAVAGGGGMTVLVHGIRAASAWYARAELRRTAQPTSGLFDPLASTGWAGRQTGVYELRFGRSVARGESGTRSVSAGIQRGFGLDRTLNAQLQFALR